MTRTRSFVAAVEPPEISGGRYYGIFLQTDWDAQGNPGGRGASNIVIEDVYVHDTGRDAIKITPKSDYVTIRRAEIARSGAGYAPGTPLDDKNAEGIDNVNGSFAIVEDSYIHDTATTGVYFKGGATDVIVQRNRIENVGIAGVLVGFDTSPEYFDTVQPAVLRGHSRHRAQQRDPAMPTTLASASTPRRTAWSPITP